MATNTVGIDKEVSVDQFIHADGGARSSSCRKHIDVLLNSMNEKELVVI